MTRRFDLGWRQMGCALLLGTFSIFAQDVAPRKHAVQISAQVQESPPRIALSWPNEGDANGYWVSRRTVDSNWQQVATLGGGETSFVDGSVNAGTKYEYQIVKGSSTYLGYGYIAAGIRIPVVDFRGKLILLVENSLAGALEGELNRLQSDLTGDGWVVIRRNASASDSPQSVKGTIRDIYYSDPSNVKAVFLIGHLPVPYSGNFFPDGHENHQGAWPADSYYGDVDGDWTDYAVQNTRAERQANWNVPGDGKFDQSNIPSRVELMVGRVDLSNMTCYANKPNSRSELDLTRQYLNKDHAFRFGEIAVRPRGLICDNFADKGADPIAGSAWRCFSAFFGPNAVDEVGWNGYVPAATQNSYLWSYGSGGGSYYYSTGVATSDDLAVNDLRVVFTMWMGSYFGDWNNESNFLRAWLGSGNVLTATYSGFPHTIYFPMALGEPIGYAIQLTQNNATNNLYPPWNTGSGQVHIALLGDPTLRMHPLRPPSNLRTVSGAGVQLSWNGSPDANVGYHLYRATAAEGPYTRITSDPVSSTSFTDNVTAGNYVYMARAVKLEQSGSGTYFNLSQGAFANGSSSGSGGNPPPPPPPPPPPLTPQASAQFVQIDTATGGNWASHFGAAGYAIATKSSILEGFSTQAPTWTWADNTSEGRALLPSPSANTRLVAGWYGDEVVCYLQLTSPQRIAFYCVDWDRSGRAETFVISDAVTGGVLDSRQISNFGDGVYLVYDLSGKVKVSIQKNAGPNALLNGVFAGPPEVAPISDRPLQLQLVRTGSAATLRVSGDAGQKFKIYSSADLQNWTEVESRALESNPVEVPLNINRDEKSVYFRTLNFH